MTAYPSMASGSVRCPRWARNRSRLPGILFPPGARARAPFVRRRSPLQRRNFLAVGKKTCSRCGVEKPQTEFYSQGVRRGVARRRSDCKACWDAYVKGRRAAGLTQEYDRARYHGNPVYRAQVAANTARWRARNPDKLRAENAVKAAIRRGDLVRQPCEACGEKAQAHHEDYSRPLDVRWLCPLHHARQHAAEGRLRTRLA